MLLHSIVSPAVLVVLSLITSSCSGQVVGAIYTEQHQGGRSTLLWNQRCHNFELWGQIKSYYLFPKEKMICQFFEDPHCKTFLWEAANRSDMTLGDNMAKSAYCDTKRP